MRLQLFLFAILLFVSACSQKRDLIATGVPVSSTKNLLYAGEEKHFSNIVQVTQMGDAKPLSFSRSSKKLLFESMNRDNFKSVFIFDLNNSTTKRIFADRKIIDGGQFLQLGDGRSVVYSGLPASEDGLDCKGCQKRSQDFYKIFALPKNSEIFVANIKREDHQRLSENDFFDGFPATLSSKKLIAYVSLEDGDPNIYLMNTDGSEKQKITSELGIEGDLQFSENGEFLYFTAYYPRTKKERFLYRKNLSNDFVLAERLELYKLNLRTKEISRVYPYQYLAFSAAEHPRLKRLLFTTNMADPKRKLNNIFAMNADGKSLEQISFSQRFDGYPVISQDGKKIAWSSARNARDRDEQNIFIADWK